MEYLQPGLPTTPFTDVEDDALLMEVGRLGRRWKRMAALPVFAGRTPTSLKNRYNVLTRRSHLYQGGDVMDLGEFPDQPGGEFSETWLS
jgi:hypothetical protein